MTKTVKKPTVRCDVCLGSGVTSAYVDGPRGPGFTQNMRCPECEGYGAIPEERVEWRMRGNDCRTVRHDMHQTQADVAAGMGVNIAYIDRMERGLNDPTTLERHWFR